MEFEVHTRKRRIDGSLEQAGWKILPYSEGLNLAGLRRHAVEELPTHSGPADYALVAEGHLLGVVEAKKLTIGPRAALTQAERYSRGASAGSFNFHGYRVPFLYSSNGEVIYFHDVRDLLATSRKLAEFHTPNALREMLGRNLSQAAELLASLSNDHPLLRDYQNAANAAAEKAISDQKRQMLIAMATGKTFTLVNQCCRLLKSAQYNVWKRRCQTTTRYI